MSSQWRFAFASVTGTSHARAGLGCQDSCQCEVLYGPTGEKILVIAASDGAGSASQSEVGSELACALFLDEIRTLLETGGSLEAVSRDFARQWMQRFRHEIRARADAGALTPRDFACTFLAAVVGERQAAFLQVGDGAIVIASAEEPDEFCWVFWPQKGEYENVTYFLTDECAAEQMEHDFVAAPISEIAVFTDGLQRLALNFAAREAHNRFFGPMLAPLRAAPPGHALSLSQMLGTYLDSPAINERADDDKTLVLATRFAQLSEDMTVAADPEAI